MARRTTKTGVREFKAHLSAYLRRVGQGETVLVTDRGRVVAEVRAPAEVPPRSDQSPEAVEARYRKGVEEGWIIPAKKPGSWKGTRRLPKPTAEQRRKLREYLAFEREERF